MRTIFVPVGLAIFVAACATPPQTMINVDGRDYAANFVENRDPVTGDLIDIRYTILAFGIQCGSRAECTPLIREAEAARATVATQSLSDDVSGTDADQPIPAVPVEVTPLDRAPGSVQE